MASSTRCSVPIAPRVSSTRADLGPTRATSKRSWVPLEKENDATVGAHQPQRPRLLRHGCRRRCGFIPADTRMPTATGESIPLADAKLLTPALPGKMVANAARWSPSLATGSRTSPSISLRPAARFSPAARRYACRSSGKVIYEGELEIVIGRRLPMPAKSTRRPAFSATPASTTSPRSRSIARSPSTRAARASYRVRAGDRDGIDLSTLVVKTILREAELSGRRYLPPAKLASLISHDMTLEAGDVVCGMLGSVGSMKPEQVSVVIDGMLLTNRFE